MRYPADLERLLGQYATAASREDVYIQRLLEDTAELFQLCDRDEYYYADMITRNLCRVIMVQQKQHNAQLRRQEACAVQVPGERGRQFDSDWELMRAFYNHFKEPEQVDYMEIADALEAGRKDLVNPTLKDYVARIYTFSGPKYLGQMFSREEQGQMSPVLFTYGHIELILATFKTRDENGNIVKQRVNIRSALRKLNEFKQQTEK